VKAVGGLGSFGRNVVFARAAGEHAALLRLQRLVMETLDRECHELVHREDHREWKAHCTLFKGRSQASGALELDEHKILGSDVLSEVHLCRMGSGSDETGYDVHYR
jgi:2'-5' RNA ligase